MYSGNADEYITKHTSNDQIEEPLLNLTDLRFLPNFELTKVSGEEETNKRLMAIVSDDQDFS